MVWIKECYIDQTFHGMKVVLHQNVGFFTFIPSKDHAKGDKMDGGSDNLTLLSIFNLLNEANTLTTNMNCVWIWMIHLSYLDWAHNSQAHKFLVGNNIICDNPFREYKEHESQ